MAGSYIRQKVIFCDIDGVLADCDHRLHYKDEKDYDSFYGIAMADDQPIKEGRRLIKALADNAGDHSDVVYITGRPERTRRITQLWLDGNFMPCGDLIMRKDGDYRKSPIVKQELVKKYLDDKTVKFDEITFIDDDPENVIAVGEVLKDYDSVRLLTFGTKRFKL